jgi:uncharacterized protein (TIGR02266 family)
MVQSYEQRRTQRVPIHFKVKVETNRGTFNGVGRDLSVGGIGVYLKKLPPIGSSVKVVFELPRKESPIGITGEVMYHSRGAAGVQDDWMGIKFVRMDADSQALIGQFVKDNLGPAKPPPLPKR